ncbi:MAG: glutamate---cysteine ligase / carboxylate-amine ligase [Miltoncostaeaceae bacterium]|nr:glutamate---cysteine ligase / carboxylate-amine ligase [Miltoncostaeaceae bacterium]
MTAGLPAWAEWRPAPAPYTLGVEEEIMLLVPGPWSLWQGSEHVMADLPPELAARLSVETHASALEIATGVHTSVAGAAAELGSLRAQLSAELAGMGLAAASAGTHPLTVWQETLTSSAERYRALYRSLRELARREPTFSLHVHVGVATAEDAVRALGRLREHLPLLLALSANSPFWQGRDSGLASARAPLFATFPRAGIPRGFPSYRAYVRAIHGLIACGAIPEPTFIWWDARLQPRFGTLELRIMDAQIGVEASAALVALAQCLVRWAVEEDGPPSAVLAAPEMLAENRFIAARDGMEALLIDPAGRALVPARELLDRVLERCAPHAEALGCADELRAAGELTARNGAARQRELAGRSAPLSCLVAALAAEFTAAPAAPAALQPALG